MSTLASPTSPPPSSETDAPAPAADSSDGRAVHIETFGCQMNVLDSELVADQLRALGYRFVDTPAAADIVLYNTCSVRDLSEQKVLSRIGTMRQRKAGIRKADAPDPGDRDVVVGVLGCMAERAGEALANKYKTVDLMVGPSELDQVPALLENIRVQRAEGRAAGAEMALSGHNARRKKTHDAATDRLEALDAGRYVDPDIKGKQAYVRITRGCNKFCAFCVVPYTRGAEVHRPADAIVDEVKKLVDGGAQEVTLLGQTINHYEQDGTSFARLLQRVHDEVPDLARLRFLTSYPRDFTDEALDVMASSERMCRFLHIPAQSGNDRVLGRMNRGYTRGEYMDLIGRAKERMPDVSILGDMIVGFPTETDAEFEDSLSLLEEVRYKSVFVFKYSPRPGTVAIKKLEDDVPDAVKKERNQRMLALQQRISLEHHQAMVGKPFEVLVEGAAKIDPARQGASLDGLVQIGGRSSSARPDDHVRLTSRTRGDHIVAFDGPASLMGQLVTVEIEAATGLSLNGVLR